MADKKKDSQVAETTEEQREAHAVSDLPAAERIPSIENDGASVMKAPANITSISYRGKEYVIGKDRMVEVPSTAVEELKAIGFIFVKAS